MGTLYIPSPSLLSEPRRAGCLLTFPCLPIQNIDTLERVAGLEPQDLVEAHGTFYTSHCVSASCRQEYSLSWMKGEALNSAGEATPPTPCPACSQVSRALAPVWSS